MRRIFQVTGDGEEKYLIATSEQSMCAYHLGHRIHPDELPIRWATPQVSMSSIYVHHYIDGK
jgi:seryl-tRNA synthetase